MNTDFAGIELARLYETQGHHADALAMYKTLQAQGRKEQQQIQAAVNRLESLLAERPLDETGKTAASEADFFNALEAVQKSPADLEKGLEGEPSEEAPKSFLEKKMAGLMEKWMMLMVLKKRLAIYRRIKARL